MTIDLKKSDDKFWNWYLNVQKTAPQTPVGKIMTEAGYSIGHTGGGCLVWERNTAGDGYLWICDLGQGLGKSVEESYLVGFYDKEGEILAQGDVPSLTAALEWCEARLICAKWVHRFKWGFHPDTRGRDYFLDRGERCLSDEQANEYDADIERLFEIAPDPYQVGLEAMGECGS